MKKKIGRKQVLFIVTMVIMSSLLVPTVFAADTYATLKGVFADIKIFSNGQQVYLDTKPLIINSTTYVPVRALGNVLNKEIGWNQQDRRIDINDRFDEGYNYALVQLNEKQNQIYKLEERIKELENDKSSSKKGKISNLSDMEKYLNKEYDKYQKIGFDIKLSGSTKDIKVKIYVNKKDDSKWSSLSQSKIKSYIQDIVDDIQDEFKNADISGYIENEYTDRQEVDFEVNSKGKLTIDYDYRSSGKKKIKDLSDMEDHLNDYYKKYDGIRFDFTLKGTEKSVRVYIDVKSSDWRNYDYQEKFLERVYEDITDEFTKAEVYGYINDDDYYFTFDSKGKVTIK
ncbi:Copper amine oxidase N-terminal domain-containing protein [Tissierella praeacuta DSM 18095]|uniref:Copper amine oxidase N-terminal domain-containing protein n=1 Tax=Tissierella praeacuta DSM 18095 TaxID=1123404 RepID=A0A1M4WMT5_9FIRM|nr:stalk domain-containing protein [Tissierella praeacuta]TCU79147.1 copper amine oxidase-like protein [Tissierella praeacuta]SHE82601.1 Copper amine oxidase N-terminal domain-containing protein [Tissierella praeacuta DSM 18095]SUO99244.1 Copper amine oxidase N-terminal domain [Tissierella praeacuta]